MKKYNIAIIGASGLVGQEFIKVINQENLPLDKIYLFSSSKSAGKKVIVNNQSLNIQELREDSFNNLKIDYAFFAVSSSLAQKYITIATLHKIRCIDNSSFFRMDDNVPLIIPPLNIDKINDEHLIISIPNCSTIECVMPLKIIDQHYQIESVNYTTYQSVSGSGQRGIIDLENTQKGLANSFYPYRIAETCIPQIESFLDNGYSKEEMKMINETKKILDRPDLKVSATCVRVPLKYTHSASIMITCKKDLDIDKIRHLLSIQADIKVIDNPQKELYPVSYNVVGKNEVYIGRIRKDLNNPKTLFLWVVSDNLRRGAAYNGIEIFKYLIRRTT